MSEVFDEVVPQLGERRRFHIRTDILLGWWEQGLGPDHQWRLWGGSAVGGSQSAAPATSSMTGRRIILLRVSLEPSLLFVLAIYAMGVCPKIMRPRLLCVSTND